MIVCDLFYMTKTKMREGSKSHSFSFMMTMVKTPQRRGRSLRRDREQSLRVDVARKLLAKSGA